MSLALTSSMNNNNTNTTQATEQGSLKIEVLMQDKYTGEITHTIGIKRAQLARLFHEQRVTGSKNGKSVVQY